jgi:hypothetical protein
LSWLSQIAIWFQLVKIRVTIKQPFFFTRFCGVGSRPQTGIESGPGQRLFLQLRGFGSKGILTSDQLSLLNTLFIRSALKRMVLRHNRSDQRRPRMKLHRNAKTTPCSRLALVRRALNDRWSYQAVAEGHGVSVRTASKIIWGSGSRRRASPRSDAN